MTRDDEDYVNDEQLFKFHSHNDLTHSFKSSSLNWTMIRKNIFLVCVVTSYRKWKMSSTFISQWSVVVSWSNSICDVIKSSTRSSTQSESGERHYIRRFFPPQKVLYLLDSWTWKMVEIFHTASVMELS